MYVYYVSISWAITVLVLPHHLGFIYGVGIIINNM